MKLGALLISALALGACGDDDVTDIGADLDPARDFKLRIENVAPWTVLKAGAQEMQPDETVGPIGPGQFFVIRFSANAGHFVTFATMLGESNDWFFAPGPDGIPLYVDGQPQDGDVTSYLRLWDAGTEVDQEPAVGDATGTQQPSRDFGDPDPDPLVREVPARVTLTDGTSFTRPDVASMIRATLTLGADQVFTLRIENVSLATTLVTSLGTRAVHLSPVAYAVHRAPNAMFEPGKPARDNGLEDLAEGGGAYPLSNTLRYARGVATPFSPGVFVLHTTPAPLFTLGGPDYGAGLERLAEDGDAVPLRDALAASPPAGVLASGELATASGAARPGEAFEIVFHAEPGDHLSFATMFGMSNDWFFATHPDGIALFSEGVPRNCDVTADVALYDLGTEANEELDVGPSTATQQAAPDTGRPDRDATVREVTVESYEPVEVQHIRVTLTVVTEP